MVVYFYSPFCSYCQVSAYTFLTVAHTLRNFTHILFARVDGENNDLPWHLVPLSYPTIMVFPTKRYALLVYRVFSKIFSLIFFALFLRSKSENKVFPMSEELTVENLLDFVLSSVDVDIKIKYMINECEKYRKIVSTIFFARFENLITSHFILCLYCRNIKPPV